MAVTFLVLLTQDIPLAFYLHQAEHDHIVTGLERDAFVLAGHSEEALESATATADATLNDLARRYRDAGGARVVIVDSAGIAVIASDDDQSVVGDSYLSRPEITDALSGKISSGHRYSVTLSQELLYVTVPVLSGEKVLGAVRLTYPDQAVTDVVNSQLWRLGIVALSSVVLAGIVGLLVSGGVARRLTRLRRTTELLADGNLSARADEKRGAAELTSLSRSFNTMAERLEELVTQQRMFAADASHQLRTPLTALRLRLDRASELLETDPIAAGERLAAAQVEVDRLGNLIEGLLLLSRTEAASAPLKDFNLAEIARNRVKQWHALATESSVRLRYEGPVDAFVSASPSAIEQIIDNFVDNALTVSPTNSTITVRVVTAGAHTTVHVLDEGPGLSREDCARAFDRFWRASSDIGGSGLGLAIVAQLARASRGVAGLAPRSGSGQTQGLDATVRFETAR
nr:HAMP domain-containing sensor histidine kinase [Alpinimonas psychrophila]